MKIFRFVDDGELISQINLDEDSHFPIQCFDSLSKKLSEMGFFIIEINPNIGEDGVAIVVNKLHIVENFHMSDREIQISFFRTMCGVLDVEWEENDGSFRNNLGT